MSTSWMNCRISTDPYSTYRPANPSEDDHQPVTLPCCGNRVCVSCVEKDRAAKIERLSNRDRKNIGCIACNESYHCEKTKFSTSKVLIDALTFLHRPLERRDENENKNKNENGVEVEVGPHTLIRVKSEDIPIPIISSMETSQEQLHVEQTAGGHLPARHTNLPVEERGVEATLVRNTNSLTPPMSTGRRPFSRSKKRDLEQDVDRSTTLSSRIESENYAPAPQRQRCTRNPSIVKDNVPRRPTVKLERNETDVIDLCISDDDNNDNNNDNDDKKAEEEWHRVTSREGVKLFRIRQFQKDSITNHDRHGQACSRWAIQKGYIASSSRIIPTSMLQHFDSTVAIQFLSHSIEDLGVLRGVDKSKYFAEHKKKKRINGYLSAYKKFAGAPFDIARTGDDEHYGIKKGDIIALLVPGPVKHGEAYFGVVISDELLLQTPSDAGNKGFPAPHLFTDVQQFNGLMLREVKWLRKAMTRALPNQKGHQVAWLNEGGPTWFCELKPKVIKQESGLDIMRSRAFFDNTEPSL